ncbi:MAG: prepilin-type N-terminal cleavage/methylation domain-containing protein [Chthoniobacterales bacterium]
MKKHARGFTLFEMVVVVAIFVLLAGGIYATVNAAVRATATLSEENLQIQRLNAFVALLRKTFHNLPATAQFSGGVRAEGGDGFPEIVLRDAPGVFAWGIGGPSAGTVLLTARARLGGGREIALMLLPGSLSEMERRDALERGAWLRLLPDVRSVQWRFYDEAQQDWVEEWAEGNRPPLVELNLEMLGEDVARKYVFWLPPVKEVDFSEETAEPAESPLEVELP